MWKNTENKTKTKRTPTTFRSKLFADVNRNSFQPNRYSLLQKSNHRNQLMHGQ